MNSIRKTKKQLADEVNALRMQIAGLEIQKTFREDHGTSAEHFQTIAETATDAIVTADNSGNIIFWNQSASTMFGYSPDDVIGRPCYCILSQSIIPLHEHSFTTADRPMTPFVRRIFEGMGKRKNSEEFPVELAVSGWGSTHDLYFTAVIRDITHRKQTEASLQRSEQELKRLCACLVNAQEQERKRIAYELHDGLGQMLSGIKIGIENLLAGHDETCGHALMPQSAQIIESIKNAIDEVRRISKDLRPSMLDDLGIIITMNWFCREFEAVHKNIHVEKDIAVTEKDIPEALKISIFRIIQEAFTNIVRHSAANNVLLRLGATQGGIELIIRDNGKGFAAGKKASESDYSGMGLSSMKERTEFSGGTFTMESTQGRGTAIRSFFPRV